MRKLLIADSSAAMRKALELAFTQAEIQVISTADGARAVEMLPVERPDALLVERTLPGRNAFEVAAFVRSHPDLRHMPVVLLLGAFETVDRERARQSGIDEVFTKPVDLRWAVARLRELATQTATTDTDAYLDRVSAALQERERRPAGPPPSAGDAEQEAAVPTLASILGETPAPDPPAPRDARGLDVRTPRTSGPETAPDE
jgi:DNA-binding response OmpR family regulator